MHSDNLTTLEMLKKMVKAFVEDRDWDQFHTPKDIAIGLVTEASEFLEHFRFKSETEIAMMLENSGKKEELADELADTLFFILRFGDKYGIDLATAVHSKLQKSAVQYPVAKARGKNVKYTELH